MKHQISCCNSFQLITHDKNTFSGVPPINQIILMYGVCQKIIKEGKYIGEKNAVRMKRVPGSSLYRPLLRAGQPYTEGSSCRNAAQLSAKRLHKLLYISAAHTHSDYCGVKDYISVSHGRMINVQEQDSQRSQIFSNDSSESFK